MAINHESAVLSAVKQRLVLPARQVVAASSAVSITPQID
jgi:hypothetical protein